MRAWKAPSWLSRAVRDDRDVARGAAGGTAGRRRLPRLIAGRRVEARRLIRIVESVRTCLG